MKILATFDGTKYSEAIMPQLQQMAHLPSVEFTSLTTLLIASFSSFDCVSDW